MALKHTFYQTDANDSRVEISLPARYQLLQTWIAGLTQEDRDAWYASVIRTEAMVSGIEQSLTVLPPVDAVWKTMWERFKTENNLEQVMSDA